MRGIINTTLLFLLIFEGCTTKKNTLPILQNPSPEKSTILKYATNFKVLNEGNHKIIEVIEPYSGAKSSLKYRLIPKIEKAENDGATFKEIIIYTPIETLVCTSTTHIAPLDMLNVSNKLTGFPSTHYISSEKVRSQVLSGKTIELGKDNDLNIELLIELSPEIVMSYSMTGDYGQLSTIEKIGIPVVQNAEYLEKTPLGRAEWIKFIALFFEKELQADSIFNEIEENYNYVKTTAKNTPSRPTVMSGVVYGDTWYVPGGGSWMAKFFRDAQTNYLWANEVSTGSLQLSFEGVYEKAQNADFWIGAGNYFSLDELKNTDHRYQNFKTFTTKSIFTYNARVIENGGNDYFESGFSRPDIVLSDLVKIIHPELLPSHKLYYFRELDKK
ncbi:MAG: ABC transporter substrate-binding protein [Cyclobacteriaceae bacterium]|nr:ABC transporter substrate-binding protein [Cyclobacteriaceae bacterium]